MKRVFPLLATAVLASTTPVAAGVYFSAVTTSAGRQGAASATASVRGWVQGEKARVEYTQSPNPLLKAGRFLLTLDGGRSIYLVDPSERTFSQWDAAAAVWSSVQPAAAIAGARIEKLGEEDGGELLGVPTRHIRYRIGAASGGATAAARPAAGVVVEEDLWVAPELAEAALGVWLQADAPASGSDAAGTPEAAADERCRTFPLKRVAVTTTTGRNGLQTVVTTTTTVTELSVEDVSPGTFTMGSGFREKPLAAAGKPGEQPSPGEAEEARQEDGQYPFEEMVPPEGGETTQPPVPAPGQPAQPVARPAVPPTPQPVVPDEPQEDPEYPFERMLDAPER